MKKKDLKTGMIVETRAGEKALIVKDNVYGVDAVIFSQNNWTDLDGFDDNLIWHGCDNERTPFAETVDIMKVYKPDLPTGFLSKTCKFGEMKPIWVRQEKAVPEYTMEQLTKKIGHEFKLKK